MSAILRKITKLKENTPLSSNKAGHEAWHQQMHPPSRLTTYTKTHPSKSLAKVDQHHRRWLQRCLDMPVVPVVRTASRKVYFVR